MLKAPISFCLIITFLVLFLEQVRGQNYYMEVQKLGIKEGLSSYNIRQIYQDQRGFIWFVSDYGLNRYDGQEIKIYTKEENGLCSNEIHPIKEDIDGNIWINTRDNNQNCISIFDPIQENFYDIETFLKGVDIPFDLSRAYVLPTARTEQVIVEAWKEAQQASYYYEYNGKTFRRLFEDFKLKDLYPEYSISTVLETEKERYLVVLTHPTNVSFMLHLSPEGKLLETTYCPNGYREMYLFMGNSNNFCVNCMNHSDSKNIRMTINVGGEIDSLNPINLGSMQGDVYRYINHKMYILNSTSLRIFDGNGQLLQEVPSELELVRDNNILFVDRDENIWIANDEYIYCLSPTKQPFQVELADYIPRKRLRGITKTDGGNLVTAEIGRLLYHMVDGWTYNKKNLLGLLHNDWGLIAEGNSLWATSEGGELFYYAHPAAVPKVYYRERNEKGVGFGGIYMPYKAPNGQIWVGSTSGLYFLDTVKGALIPMNRGQVSLLSKSTVYSFYKNKEGTWLATSSGLYLVNLEKKEIIAHYSSTQEGDQFIPCNHIAHLYEDEKGVFWLATKGSGLIRWNPKTKRFKQYTQKGAGLSHNVLYSVYGDAYGSLWISSQRGLMRFYIENEHVEIFLKEDGLPHNEFNTISHYQDKNGRLYFGGQNGMIHFHPKDFKPRETTGTLIVTDYYKQTTADSLIQLTADLRIHSTINFEPDDKTISLRFALLDYNNSKNQQYSYQIVGYDQEWNFLVSNQLTVNYLPYGNYQLKLRAKASNSNQWTVYPKQIKIKVLRPFYLKPWFIGFCICVLILTLYGIFRWRIRQLEMRKNELESIVKKRTAQIEEDKKIIEKDKVLIEEQAEELRALDKVKSRFFANISHELRTPLTLILGPLSYLLDQPEDLEKKVIQQQLLTMQRNGKNLMQLIEEILDLSKLEANKLELIEEGTAVRQFFEHVFVTFKPQFKHLGLNYELRMDLQTDNLIVLLDRKKVEKVLNNFISNAIKFTPKAGNVQLLLTETDTNLTIKVSDSGQGIHPNDLPHIFERFYQSKQANQKLYGGTGIGLALVSEFAQLMGGETYVESEYGEGSRFYFELPKKVIQVEQIVKELVIDDLEEELIDSIGTDFTILVVEDNKDMQDFICQVLRNRYKEVLTANNGAEGLERLRTYGTEIDLIVSDIMMPEIDGLTMLQTIKTNVLWRQIPVIMLTALAAERDKLTALTIGVDDYLTKPFSVSELLVRIQNLLYNYHERLKIFEGKEPLTLSLDVEEQRLEAIKANRIHSDVLQASESNKKWVEKIEGLIKKSINDKILNVEKLSEQLFISKRQLTRKLKSITGLTPAKFIREVQLQQARIELENGNFISITEVAYNNAFDNPNSFSTLFKKRFGKPPSAYVKTI